MNKKIRILLSVVIVCLSALIMAVSNNKIIVANAFQNEKSLQTNLRNVHLKEYFSGWIIADCVNIRKKPTVDAKVIGQLYFNEKILFINENRNWIKILYEEEITGYINRKYVSKNKPKYQTYNVPYTNGKKTFMPYKVHKNGKYVSIFSVLSKQYKLQQYCHSGEYGIRQYKNRFCVAIGSAFGVEIGQYFDLCLENGEIINCIMADQKADVHTDSLNIATLQNGCMSEFVVDNEKLNSNAKRMGDISYCTDLWKSRVVKVKVYKKFVEL